MFPMEVLDKLGRLAKLGGIIGLALGSLALTVCGGRTGDDRDGATSQDAAPMDAGLDATSGPDAAGDASGQLDAQLWDVICE